MTVRFRSRLQFRIGLEAFGNLRIKDVSVRIGAVFLLCNRAVRLCTSWATSQENVDKLCNKLRQLAKAE